MPRTPTTGKTPLMAFVLDYLREFPGAGYDRVKSEAQAAGVGGVTPLAHGHAVRILRDEAARAARDEAEPPALQDEHKALLAERARVLKKIADLGKAYRARHD